MKSRLTLIAGALALAVAIGAVVGFIRRRLERGEAGGVPSTNGSIGSRNGSAVPSRGDRANADGDRGIQPSR